jgi:membrane protein
MTTKVERSERISQKIWDHVSHSPLQSLWDFQGVSRITVMKRTFRSFNQDNLLSRAAELGYYFLFALFPTLVCATSILGFAARGASSVYSHLLTYLAIVIPHSAFAIILTTFKETSAKASGGKITLGLAAALWSASVGFSAIQDAMNIVYKVKETRSYWKARGAAILVTLLLSMIVTLTLASLLAGDFIGGIAQQHFAHHFERVAVAVASRTIAWAVAAALLILLFAVIYFFAPDVKNKRWHWLTPGSAIGIAAWLLASIALRIYLHFFDSYSLTYGSLGAVIILLTWFYITGLMLLTGAEINSEIAAAVAERHLRATGAIGDKAQVHAFPEAAAIDQKSTGA